MRLLSAAVLAASALPAAAATDGELRAAIVGSWSNTPACDQSILTFAADGGFMLRNVILGEDGPPGSYTIVDGRLNGETGDSAMPEVTLVIDNGSLFFTYLNGETEQLHPCTLE